MTASVTKTEPISTAGAALDAATIPEAFQRTAAMYPDKTAIRDHLGEVSYAWAEYATEVEKAARGLHGLGVKAGDTVALMLPNVLECHLLDHAVSHLGGIPFAIFNSSPSEQIAHQLSNADASVVATLARFLPQVQAAADSLHGQVRHIIVIDGEGGTADWADVRNGAGGESLDFESTWRAIQPSDLATLIYTSGTTGPPKGAQWTHNTVMAEQRAMAAALPMPTEAVISFLPMAHAGGRITAQYMSLIHGATVTCCPDMAQVGKFLAEVHPDAFFAVPRLWEKLQVAIEAMIEGQSSEDERATLRRAVELGHERVHAEENRSEITPERCALYDQALAALSPLVTRLGLDRIKAAYVGGAPSTPELAMFFRAVGVPMLEAYGLTEGSLNIFNRVEDFRLGSSGKPLPGVEIKLADDGELLVRSELVFAGYRKQPDQTAEAIDVDGWLHTGDIARVDPDGFVSIVDRKKEIIISSSGKNMSPANIEAAIKGESSLIGQVVAIGDGRKFVSALITLDPEALPTYASRLGIADTSTLAEHPDIHREIEGAVQRGNERLHSNEQVKKFAVLPTAWAVGGEELTPTAKLRRRVIYAKYADQIEQFYAD